MGWTAATAEWRKSTIDLRSLFCHYLKTNQLITSSTVATCWFYFHSTNPILQYYMQFSASTRHSLLLARIKIILILFTSFTCFKKWKETAQCSLYDDKMSHLNPSFSSVRIDYHGPIQSYPVLLKYKPFFELLSSLYARGSWLQRNLISNGVIQMPSSDFSNSSLIPVELRQ